MNEPTQIPVEALNLNTPETPAILEQSPAQQDSPAVKLSLDEFENYTPTGKKPELDSKGKLVHPLGTEELDRKKTSQVEGEDDPEEIVLEKEETPKDEKEVVKGEGEEEEIDPNDPVKDKDLKNKNDGRERDYTGFDEEEKKLLKRLDSYRFPKIAERWKALKQAAGKSVELVKELESAKKMLKEGGVPETWYEHPDAYQLSPEFNKITQEYNQQNALEQHYQSQLLAVQQGKQWYSVTGIDPKTGNLVYSQQPHEATDHAAVWLQQQMFKATSAKGALEGKSASLAENFKQSHEKAAAQIKNETEYIIQKMRPDVKPQDKDIDMVVQTFPQQYRNHPLAYSQARFGAIILAQGRVIAKLEGEQVNKNRIQQDVKKAGPSNLPPRKPASGLGSSNGKLSMKDFGPDNY